MAFAAATVICVCDLLTHRRPVVTALLQNEAVLKLKAELREKRAKLTFLRSPFAVVQHFARSALRTTKAGVCACGGRLQHHSSSSRLTLPDPLCSGNGQMPIPRACTRPSS
jgi:hypothetical protein